MQKNLLLDLFQKIWYTSIMKRKIYYAHSMKIYNTPREKQERAYLEKIFGSVICPNRDMEYDGNGMALYLKQVKNSTMVICSEFKNHIGRGVFDEVELALKKKIPCFVLRDKSLINITNITKVDENNWYVYYGMIES